VDIRINFILPETRVPELHDSCYSIGLSVFTFTQLFSKAKKRCSGRALTRDPALSFNVFFLENPTEYPHKPYTARNYNPCKRLAPLTVGPMCLSLLVFIQLFFEVARSQPAKPARKQNLTRNSRSMLCILGSLKSRRRTAYRYTITLASSLKYLKNTNRKC